MLLQQLAKWKRISAVVKTVCTNLLFINLIEHTFCFCFLIMNLQQYQNRLMILQAFTYYLLYFSFMIYLFFQNYQLTFKHFHQSPPPNFILQYLNVLKNDNEKVNFYNLAYMNITLRNFFSMVSIVILSSISYVTSIIMTIAFLFTFSMLINPLIHKKFYLPFILAEFLFFVQIYVIIFNEMVTDAFDWENVLIWILYLQTIAYIVTVYLYCYHYIQKIKDRFFSREEAVEDEPFMETYE